MDQGIWRYDHDANTSVYLMKNDDGSIRGYHIVVKSNGEWWAMESWVSPFHLRKGIWRQLLLFSLGEKKRLYMDKSMSEDAIKAFENIIRDASFKVYVADWDDEEVTRYDPARDAAKPMYDRAISGLNRPILPKDQAERFSWVIEESSVRPDRWANRSILSEYILFTPDKR